MSKETTDLLEQVERIDRIRNDEWLASLNARKREELEFHNRDRDPELIKKSMESQDTFEKFYGNKKYYNATDRSRIFLDDWIKQHAPGKVFLDYACGNGRNALMAAHAGAALALGLDISNVSVSNCQRAAKEQGLTNARFFQADAENTQLPDSSVDLIVCSGMLHHLDLSYAFAELRRILRPGGRILAVESLDYNPLIKIYRMITPAMRTDWEKAHILSLRDLKFASRFFDVRNVHYWHITGYVGGKFPALLPLLDLVDRGLERIPFVNRMAWIFTFELWKRAD